jgi:hypothetical protein
MNLSTNINTKGSFAENARRSDVIWHASPYSPIEVGGQILIGHGISRDMIGHQIQGTDGINILDVSIASDQLAGTILFLE